MTDRNRRPDILWIVTTQWRAQATGYGGDPNARTPHLDALAARSVNYSQAITPHPFGPFARAALLTGVPSPQNGVRDYFDPLPQGSRTIAQTLAGRGYHTAFFGKWHLGDRDRFAPLVGEAHARTLVPVAKRGGFHEWEGFEGGFLLNNPWLHGSLEYPLPVQVNGYQSEILVDRILKWQTGRRQDEVAPWFAVLSLEAPHPPYDAPANGVPPRSPDSIVLRANVSRGGAEEVKARRELAGYYAHIEATDAAIGRLVKALPESVLVVFTSVHGDMHGSHGLFRKGWPYEESVRVPLLVRGAPSTSGMSLVCPDPVSLLDLPAMTQAWSDGLPWRCLRQDAAISMPSVVSLTHQCDRAWQGRRSATGKVVTTAQGDAWMEFDLIEDPFEQHNLAPRGQ
ncbi:MAG: sulfatase-like hydrolase/transferase [Opitutaceae bacterium]|nr:sulfatase-like hydrolase/transferase [Opitutaceae bacterium]